MLHDFIDQQKKRLKCLEEERKSVKASKELLFFESCAERMRNMPDNIQGVLQIQIQQLLYNAENMNSPPLAIMPLPRPLEQIDTCSQVYSSAMSTLQYQ